MQAFNYDQDTDLIIIQSKQYALTYTGERKHFNFRIYDPAQVRVIYETAITNKALIGRLKGGLFTFVNGHIYYNNNVIKVRYDLINSDRATDIYKENEIFDFYFDIFPLPKSDRVKADTPLDSMLAKRFCYIIHDTTRKKP